MTLQILDQINHGYQDLEPTVVGLMALHKSFMLIGRHGTGKTRLARALSRGYGEDGFAFYDATKDDLISVAGIPDPDSLKKGRLRFVAHERSIWSKSTIVVDEITRAGKESQNLWLEILEERTCFGLPLAYRTLIATANPESYAAAFQLDEALLDRFHAVLPVPEHQERVSPDQVKAMLALAAKDSRKQPLAAEELARVFAEIQHAHAGLLRDGARSRVADYLGQLVPALLGAMREQDGPYVSTRTYARNLPETILAVAAYYQVAGASQPLVRGAADALRYAVATKFQIKPMILESLHRSAEAALRRADVGSGEKLRLELAAQTSFEDRLAFLGDHWAAIHDQLPQDEFEKLLGELLRGASKKGEQEKLVELRHALESNGYRGDALRQVDGRLLIALNSAISLVTPKLGPMLDGRTPGKELDSARSNVERFRALVADGVFLGSHDREVRRLQAYLIDLKEGDVPDTPDALFELFASLSLPEGA